ncbi:MAG: aldo/keto reductase [Eubacteriaceae bacterium]|nr:aldo/keto reductase [Eubacteriaceae bacterium]
MLYRNFKKDELKVSQLGFGCMRLPVTDNDASKIDRVEASKMLKYAIDNGVNYIDTAWPYHGENSETFVGDFLEEYELRDKVLLATKLPTWMTKTYEDFNRYLEMQLKKLKTDHIDFYLLHSLDKEKWENLNKIDILKFIEEVKSSGKVKYIGFSFHDDLETFKKICDSYSFDFCQIQLNYMDENYQAGLEGLSYAASKNIPVIVMEPIKGGKLAFNLQSQLAEIWDPEDASLTPAELALKYVWDKPEVLLVLSGMTTMEQVIANVDSASRLTAGSLSESEKNLIGRLRAYIKEMTEINCTSCQYCCGCPKQIPIWSIFDMYNNAKIYDALKSSKFSYQFISPDRRADQCIQCGACEEVCPQKIKIMENLAKIHPLLT